MKRCLLTFTLFFLPGFVASSAEVRLPKYTREVLPNGAVVYLVPKPGVPLVSMRILIKGGFESEPALMAGLSSVTAQLLRAGTARRSAAAFSEELDGLGGTFLAATNEQYTTITSEFLRKDFAAGFDLATDAMLHPAFPDAEVKKILARSVDNARSSKDNPQAAVSQYFRAFFFGPSHPYGHPVDEVSYGRITRDRIVDYASRMYVGRNVIAIIAGDFDPAAAGESAKKILGALPAGTAYSWVSDAKPAPGGRLLLVDKPDATQTYFVIGQPGISHTDPDRTVLNLVNTLFGGRFTSMLNDALRVNSGLTYGASSSLDLFREPGSNAIRTYTRTETTGKAMDMALDVLKQLTAKGISAEQLASVKSYVKGLYPTRSLETPDQIATVLGDIEVYGQNRGEVDDLFSRIDAVTVESANAAVKKWYRPENLTFVVLGNASAIRDSVKKYAAAMKEIKAADPGWGN